MNIEGMTEKSDKNLNYCKSNLPVDANISGQKFKEK